MLSYLKAFVFVITFCMSDNVFAESNQKEFISDREGIVREMQGILIHDKNTNYKNELASVDAYPDLSHKNIKSFSIDYHTYVKSLLPYMLKKLKNNDINGEFQTFHKLMTHSEDIEKEIDLSQIEIVSFELLKESLKTEKILRACSHAISKYGDKKQQIEIELNRLDGIKSENMTKAVELTNDYSSLRRSISSTVGD